MEAVQLSLKTGEGKRTWYAFTITVGEFSSDLQFIDKIHYDYLKANQPEDKLDLENE